eukprot:7836153-Pyramimonas_sp.AAC.1
MPSSSPSSATGVGLTAGLESLAVSDSLFLSPSQSIPSGSPSAASPVCSCGSRVCSGSGVSGVLLHSPVPVCWGGSTVSPALFSQVAAGDSAAAVEPVSASRGSRWASALMVPWARAASIPM